MPRVIAHTNLQFPTILILFIIIFADDGKSSREEEPATTKGIVHGSCDGSVNIERFGHEEEEEIMTTKKVEAKAPPPHKNNTALKRNDIMEGRNTEFFGSNSGSGGGNGAMYNSTPSVRTSQ